MAKTCLTDEGARARRSSRSGHTTAVRSAAARAPSTAASACAALPARPRAQGADSRPDRRRAGERRMSMTDPDRRPADAHPQRQPAPARSASTCPWSRHQGSASRACWSTRAISRDAAVVERGAGQACCASACATIAQRRPVITGIQRVSRPSLRVYVGAERDPRRARRSRRQHPVDAEGHPRRPRGARSRTSAARCSATVW